MRAPGADPRFFSSRKIGGVYRRPVIAASIGDDQAGGDRNNSGSRCSVTPFPERGGTPPRGVSFDRAAGFQSRSAPLGALEWLQVQGPSSSAPTH
jgi:hypothetical protein